VVGHSLCGADCRKDKGFCEHLFTLYRHKFEKDKQQVNLAPMENFLRMPMASGDIMMWRWGITE